MSIDFFQIIHTFNWLALLNWPLQALLNGLFENQTF